MLPSLGVLSLGAPTGAQDDVVTEIRDEQAEALHKAWEWAEEEQEEEEALGPQLEELRAKAQALRETYRSEKRAAPVRKEVFDNEDLVKEVLLALDHGNGSWDVCKLVVEWCGLNKAHRAACKERLWDELGARIWGEEAMVPWSVPTDARRHFRLLCETEHDLRSGVRHLRDLHYTLRKAKRVVLAAIAGGDYHVLYSVDPTMRDDEDVVRAAVAKDARAIQFASPRLQGLIDPLRPTVYWPPDPAMETEFTRRWGDAVLHILLYGDWVELTIKMVRTQLLNEHPEVGRDYFRVTHRADLTQLIDVLMLHIQESIQT